MEKNLITQGLFRPVSNYYAKLRADVTPRCSLGSCERLKGFKVRSFRQALYSWTGETYIMCCPGATLCLLSKRSVCRNVLQQRST